MRTRLLFPAVALLGALVACSANSGETAPANDAASAPGAAASALSITVSDFMIEPADLEVAGPTVTIETTNDGPTPHNFTVRDASGEIVMATADLSTGDSETITADLEPGDYTTFCSLAGHESLGMSGTLTVTGR